MRRTLPAAFLLLPIVAACSGGSGSAPNVPPRVATVASDSQMGAPLRTESQADAASEPQWHTSSPVDLLYVGNTGDNSITVYRHDVSGNTAPLRVIGGAKTGISNPGQLSEDAHGNLYVANSIANDVANTNPAILVFAHGANGNVAPIRKLAGPKTSLHYISAMTVDQTTGKLFVVDSQEVCPGSGVAYNFFCGTGLLRFPPDAGGDTAPFARSAFGDLLPGIEIASDSSGKNIIEAHTVAAPEERETGLDTYPKQFPNGADIGSLFDIAGFSVNGVADDPSTATYLTSEGASIYRLKESTYNLFGGSDNSLKPPPVSAINTNVVCGQLALGYLRNIYAVCGNAVNVYTSTASGSAAPLRVLSGPATKLNKPYGIYEGQ